MACVVGCVERFTRLVMQGRQLNFGIGTHMLCILSYDCHPSVSSEEVSPVSPHMSSSSYSVSVMSALNRVAIVSLSIFMSGLISASLNLIVALSSMSSIILATVAVLT